MHPESEQRAALDPRNQRFHTSFFSDPSTTRCGRQRGTLHWNVINRATSLSSGTVLAADRRSSVGRQQSTSVVCWLSIREPTLEVLIVEVEVNVERSQTNSFSIVRVRLAVTSGYLIVTME